MRKIIIIVISKFVPLVFYCVAKNIIEWLKIFIVFLAYSHTWLNFVRDDGHFFYGFLPMVASLTINKTPWKKHFSEDECKSPLLHHSWGVSCKQKVKLLSMISWANLLSLLWQTWLSVQYNYIVEEKKTWVLQSSTKALNIIQVWHKSNELKRLN